MKPFAQRETGVSGRPLLEPGTNELPAEHVPVARQLAVIFVARTALNTSHRIVYPFLPALARGLGISLGVAGSLVTLRMLAGLAAPALGSLADRQGRRRLMEMGLALMALASLLLASLGSYAAALIAFVLFGLAKVLYDPSVHAYIGDVVPYSKRGRAIGLVELSWSASWLAGVPLAGYLIETSGWRAPCVLLIGLGLLGLGLTRMLLPPGRPVITPASAPSPTQARRARWLQLLRQPGVFPLLAASASLTMANEIPFIVYGAWLEESYSLSLTALGLASTAIGVSEAVAEFGNTLLTDRWGKRNSLLIGLVAMAGAMVLLPNVAQLGFAASLAGLVLMMLFFEFAIVSLLPVATEIAPRNRALLLSLNLAAMSLGRLVGGTSGSWIWEWGSSSIKLHAYLGAALAILAAALVGFGTVELEGTQQPDV